MATPMSPQLIPMTPAFGPMQGSALPYAAPVANQAPVGSSYGYSNAPSQNFDFRTAAPRQTVTTSAPIPDSYASYPQMNISQQQFNQYPTFPSYPTTIYQSANQGIAQNQYISSVAPPKPFPSAYTSILDPYVNYISPQELANLGQGPKNIPVTRIAHTQVIPLPDSPTNPENFIPVSIAPKYSTQMSARVKYQGPAFKGELRPKPAFVPDSPRQQSITVSVKPMPKPNQLPVAAQSYAMVASNNPHGKLVVSCRTDNVGDILAIFN